MNFLVERVSLPSFSDFSFLFFRSPFSPSSSSFSSPLSVAVASFSSSAFSIVPSKTASSSASISPTRDVLLATGLFPVSAFFFLSEVSAEPSPFSSSVFDFLSLSSSSSSDFVDVFSEAVERFLMVLIFIVGEKNN